jgi:hypothetical protein
MIQILLERFLINNPHPGHENKNKNVEKYRDKKINTFIFVLDEIKCIEIDWDWDKNLTMEIKQHIKKTMMIYYSDNHKYVYTFLNNIIDKKNKGKYWGVGIGTPFEYISNKMKAQYLYPRYIVNFFENLHEMWSSGNKKEAKGCYEKWNDFITNLNKKLEISIDCYLGLLEMDEDF